MTKIALMGAGGKMGVRLASNLKGSRFDIAPVEVAQEGRARLRDATGLECVEVGQALSRASVVVLAVPDRAIGTVAHEIVPRLDPGTAVIVLDAAAPHAGEMPERDDVTYFVTHPCHPPIFNDEDGDARLDFFGGVKAKQHIVCALMQGPEDHYALCEEVARTIYAPVMRAHRCTVEQIAILEPALSETVGATLALALREATDEAVRRGVPEEAAHDFMLGHLNIELAIAFGIFPDGKFSDGALHAITKAKPQIFRDDWLDRVFAPDSVLKSVHDICHPDAET
ncbi:MAG: semialdehyde dehydrogenase [Natronohydrobacter sp.]|nr:semialdehyde dehydrogenase [Natronohydrobacter sp.]